MTLLYSNSPLRSIAHVLFSARLLSPGAWDGGGKSRPDKPPGEPELSRDLLELFTILRDRSISYVLVGGVALLRYVEGRNTEDIDLLLSLASLSSLPEIALADQNRDFARGQFRSVRVDLLLTENPLFRAVHDHYATAHRFHEMDVRVASVEGLLLLKLYALPALYRQGNGQRIALYEADITMLLQKYSVDTDSLFKVLEPFVDADALGELRQIITEIRGRIARIARSRKIP